MTLIDRIQEMYRRTPSYKSTLGVQYFGRPISEEEIKEKRTLARPTNHLPGLHLENSRYATETKIAKRREAVCSYDYEL